MLTMIMQDDFDFLLWGGMFVFLKFSTMNICYSVKSKIIKNYYGAINLYTFSCFTYKKLGYYLIA